MNKTKKICYIAMLTALYVVLSAFLKFYIGVGHIQVDLGYIAFSVSLCMFGIYGTFVGVIGCAIESTLFTAYGFSISWAVANAIIGIGCGLLFPRLKHFLSKALIILLFCGLGFLLAKTAIECILYSIPVAVKIPKSIAAFSADSIVMIAGLFFYDALANRLNLKRKNDGALK